MNLPKLKEIPPQKLFLIDSLGALLSALLLGLVLAQFDKTFGMPQNVLYMLSAIPCIFAIYSFLCFLIKTTYWQFLMKIIATANILYCFLTLSMMVYFYPQLTILGLLYFALEIIVVALLAFIEWKTTAHFVSNK